MTTNNNNSNEEAPGAINGSNTKRQSIGKTGVHNSNGQKKKDGEGYQFHVNVEGLADTDIFMYGTKGQEDKFLKTRKALCDMVGISKDYGNIMYHYLTEKEDPQFPEQTEPKPAKEGRPISMDLVGAM